jgi:hypothetical protein
MVIGIGLPDNAIITHGGQIPSHSEEAPMSSSGKKLGWLIAGLCLVLSGRTFAAANPATCENDIDCMATPQCGGDVCNFGVTPHVCAPAGTGSKGMDGWCTTDSDCKCKAQGATCKIVYCSFTKASDAPAGTGGAAGGTGGSSGGSGGKSGGSDAGTSSSSSGGCAVAGHSTTEMSTIAGLGLLAIAVLRRARRRL